MRTNNQPNEMKCVKKGQDGRQCWPLFLVDRLLPHGHVLGVFLQPVERWVRLHPDAIVMILRVASVRFMREKREHSEEEMASHRCNHYYYPRPSKSLRCLWASWYVSHRWLYTIMMNDCCDKHARLQPHLFLCTWCRGGVSSGPWRPSGWAFRRRRRWPGPASAPDSASGNGYTGSSAAGSLPPLSRSCPAATAAKNTQREPSCIISDPQGTHSALWSCPGQKWRGARHLIYTSKDR